MIEDQNLFFKKNINFVKFCLANVKETFWHGVDKFQPRKEKMKLLRFCKSKEKTSSKKTWNNFEEDIKPSCGMKVKVRFCSYKKVQDAKKVYNTKKTCFFF